MAQTRNGKKTEDKEANRPVFTRRFWTGNGSVEAAVFQKEVKNDNGDFVTHNVALKRTYKDGDEYKEAKGFRYEDLPWLILALQQSCDFVASLSDPS